MVAALAVGLPAAPSVVAQEAAAAHWTGTWESSPQPIWGPDFIAPLKYPRNLWNQTVRQVSRVSIGGPRIRVLFSNEFCYRCARGDLFQHYHRQSDFYIGLNRTGDSFAHQDAKRRSP